MEKSPWKLIVAQLLRTFHELYGTTGLSSYPHESATSAKADVSLCHHGMAWPPYTDSSREYTEQVVTDSPQEVALQFEAWVGD
jgi:hypothetical protein